MRAKKRMSGPEIVCWIQEMVDNAYGGSSAVAADRWGVLPGELREVLGSRRKPSKKLLAAIGYQKEETVYYVRVEQ